MGPGAPEEHTRLVRNAIDKTEVTFARAVRLLKHWNRRSQKSMCSWNIKALALGCLHEPMSQLDALRVWFDDAIDELSVGETEDPAHVAEKPISLNEPRTQVVARLREAAHRLKRAVAFEESGYAVLAWEELALLFNDAEMMPRPPAHRVQAEQARKVTAEQTAARQQTGAPAVHTGVGAGAFTDRKDVRSWAP